MTKQLATGPINALICVFFIVLGLFITIGPVEAFSIDENFDNYTSGLNINGQGDWINPYPDNVGPDWPIVSNSKSFSPPNSLSCPSNNRESTIIYNASSSHYGILNLKFFSPTSGYGPPYSVYYFAFVNYPGLSTGAIFSFYQNYPATNTISVMNNYSFENVCSLPMNIWNDFKMEYEDNTLGNRIRYNCNNAGWSSWFPAHNTLNDINGIVFYNTSYPDITPISSLFIDDLEINAGCSTYGDRETCIAQHCYWENIIFHEEYSYCRDAEPGVNYCEYSVFGCAYCNSSTTCAGATGCYWNGLAGCSYLENVCEFEHLENCENSTDCENASGTWNGDFCFVSNIGPVDCSSMNLLERLVCEIKNFITTAFLPSKAKLTELGQTIDLINTKFPSNYLRAGRVFFDNVKNGINESEGIPVKILGHEQDLSFDIFNATGTAGSVGTLGNFLKVFFNLVFITIFITWAIAFLRRIFK